MRYIVRLLITSVIISLIFGFLLIPTSEAHVPNFEAESEGLEEAVKIDDPTKSWVLYGNLPHHGGARYYKMHLNDGDRLRLTLFSPDQDFILSLVVMGPGIVSEGTVPDFVETLNGTGTEVLQGKRPDTADYEPFTPGSYYYFVDFDRGINASGIYYIAVYHPDKGGNFGLAVGYREEFTIDEWIRVPIDAINIHIWEGQNPGLIIAPLIITVIAGILILIFLRPKGIEVPKTDIWRWFVIITALIYLGSGIMMFTQMGRAMTIANAGAGAAVTSIFAILPVIFATIMFKIALKLKKEVDKGSRAKMLMFAVLGLFLWAGLIFGPIMAVSAALWPNRFFNLNKD
jgi:hypothetical protein